MKVEILAGIKVMGSQLHMSATGCEKVKWDPLQI